MQKKLIFICILIIGCILTGCASIFVQNGQSEIVDERTFIDDQGDEFTVEEPYSRIVTLYSAHTENLFELGVGERIIGANSTSIYPPEAAFLPRYDYREDPEPLIAAEPDLVIIRPFVAKNFPGYIQSLKKAGLTIVSLYPESEADFGKYIRILGMLTGSQENAEIKLAELGQRIEEIERITGAIEERQIVFFESTKTNYRTVTPDSMPGMAILRAGGVNLAANASPMTRGSSIAEYGVEKLMLNSEEIDIYISQRGAMNSGGSMISIPQREGFKAIRAVREGRILELNEKIISSPTFRYYKGIMEIARMLYPELMDDYRELRRDEPISREEYALLTVRLNHVPIFIPSSSHYYEREYRTHTYGLFTDVSWDEEYFDYIETAVLNSYIQGYENEAGEEYFDRNAQVTREDLAFTLYIMGDFGSSETHQEIRDIEGLTRAAIIQKVVDHGLMQLEGGYFHPDKVVTANEAIEYLEHLKKEEYDES
jgi:iron complex transport system substrate-binding protein